SARLEDARPQVRRARLPRRDPRARRAAPRRARGADERVDGQVKVTRKAACLFAAFAGLVGAGLLAITMSPGDGEHYVHMRVRGALVLLVFSVTALALALHPPKQRVAWALTAASNAIALGVAFGFLKSSSVTLRPVEVLGAPIIAAAAAQLSAF